MGEGHDPGQPRCSYNGFPVIELTEDQVEEHLAVLYSVFHVDYLCNHRNWDADMIRTLYALRDKKVRRVPNISYFKKLAHKGFTDRGHDSQMTEFLVALFVRATNYQPRKVQHATYV